MSIDWWRYLKAQMTLAMVTHTGTVLGTDEYIARFFAVGEDANVL